MKVEGYVCRSWPASYSSCNYCQILHNSCRLFLSGIGPLTFLKSFWDFSDANSKDRRFLIAEIYPKIGVIEDGHFHKCTVPDSIDLSENLARVHRALVASLEVSRTALVFLAIVEVTNSMLKDPAIKATAGGFPNHFV